ncbi:MAG: hypothetical protein ACD_9C00310G0001 [uncultured bacterium]|nr:MAG: hypothetical protein ACD_9C00310G0001 [uncultured bacterium]
MIPKDIEADWAAIENVLQKGHEKGIAAMAEKALPVQATSRKFPADGELNSWKKDLEETMPKSEIQETKPLVKDDFVDEWTSDIEDLEREIKAQQI